MYAAGSGEPEMALDEVQSDINNSRHEKNKGGNAPYVKSMTLGSRVHDSSKKKPNNSYDLDDSEDEFDAD